LRRAGVGEEPRRRANRRAGRDDFHQQRGRARALEAAKAWVGTIAPAGVLGYKEEDARGVWQTGNAAFMRNWPYAYALGNGDDSAVKGKFDVAPLPSGGAGSAATLGGWNIAVSKYSRHREAAVELALFLGSAEVQKQYALQNSHLPTIVALYDDADIKARQPIIPRWKEVFLNAVPRPSRRPSAVITRCRRSSGARCTTRCPATAARRATCGDWKRG